VEKFEFGVGDDDRKRLLHFIDSLQHFLGELIEGDDYFQAKFRNDYKKVWAELNPHFSALKDALQRADTNTLLSQGLLGSPLNFKLKVINHFTEEFLLYGIEITGGHKVLEKLLQTISRLLESMVATVGSGAAIQNFTDYIGLIIRDDN
jgi:hypothetical protein